MQILSLRFWIVNFVVLLFTPLSATTAVYRDELTFLGRTTYLFRDYSLVIPLDIKRQQLPGEVFTEIKAWGAWNGSWIPYIYEPIDVPGAMADDLNSIIARYRQTKGDSRLNVHKRKDNSFVLNYDKGRTRFELETKGFVPRATQDNPEGRLMLGVTDAQLNVNGHRVTGRVAAVLITPGGRSDSTGRYGLYDHFTLQFPSGAILVAYHSMNRPAFNLAALLTPDGKGDLQGRKVRISWQKLWRDAESGREIPTAWTVQASEFGLRADLEEWGRTLVPYKTDAGKTAVSVNVMVRGSVEIAGNRVSVFGLNTHVQDE
jgi:hypothetical protein